MTGLASCRVAPFGHPGINACVPLPLAYRSLPRPSSPPCAQASPTCLLSLDYNTHSSKHNAYHYHDPHQTFQPTTIARTARNARRPSVSSVNHCVHHNCLLDEMPPFNKDSQIRDLPLLPLSNSAELLLSSKSFTVKQTAFSTFNTHPTTNDNTSMFLSPQAATTLQSTFRTSLQF